MFSKIFIQRPIFASVVSIVIVIAGFLSLQKLAIEEYPSVTPPQVSIFANYPGASAQTIATTVAPILEDAVNGVENLLYVSSRSSNGRVSVSAVFEIGTDINDATIEVSNRVQTITKKLPEAVQRLGVTVRKRGSNFLQIIALNSPDNSKDPVYLSNYALINIVDELKRVEGVGDIMLMGSKDYSFRIWFYPDMLSKYKLTPNDLIFAIQEQNNQFAAGKFGEEPISKDVAFTYSVSTPARLDTLKEFQDIIIKVHDNSVLRLKDVAKVELGAQNYTVDARMNLKSVVPIGIFLQPGANAIKTADLVNEKITQLAKNFPSGVSYQVPYNTTEFVKIAITEVVKTFVEAMILVTLVVYMFLGSFRATIIPVLAVPVSIIGTFAGMYLLGFSINLLTMFGLVLAIGIVVDDAIIVIENVERNMKSLGLNAKDASIKAMQEVSSPVVSIVLVLLAVFIPVSFMGGFTGQMYKQFALTIVISVAISGFVALTLTPALCATFLKPIHKDPPFIIKKFNQFFDFSTSIFTSGVQKILKHSVISVLVVLVLAGFSYKLFTIIPTSLVPAEDKGSIFAVLELPSGSSLQRTIEVRDKTDEIIRQNPNISSSIAMAGFGLSSMSEQSNAATFFVNLKDWKERPQDSQSSAAIAMGLNKQFFANPDARIFALTPPAINGLGSTGGFNMEILDRNGKGYEALLEKVNAIIFEASKSKIITSVRTNLDMSTPQYDAHVDTQKAKMLGVAINDIFATLQVTLGSYYVNDFNLFGKTYKVNIQADGKFRESPQNLKDIFVRSKTGEMIALSSLMSFTRSTGAGSLSRFNVFGSASVTGQAQKGYSSGDAMNEIEKIATKILGDDYLISWSGASYQEKQIGSSSFNAFLFAVLFVFLILAAQYERWLMPLGALTAIPFAIFGAILAVFLRGLNNDIYFQIGLVMLIGLSVKNAILIVEFAMQKKEEGLSIVNASIEAARLRFRPIIMTSLAFTIGVLPLFFSTGAGAGSRHSIGTGVIGGMIAASTLSIFFVPLFYVLLEKLNAKFKGKNAN